MSGESNIGNSDFEEGVNTFWDSVKTKDKAETVSLIDCPYCNTRLRVPVTYSGRVKCANCNKVFDRENGQIYRDLYDKKGRVSVLTNAQRSARVNAPTSVELGISMIWVLPLVILILFAMFYVMMIFLVSSSM